MTFLGEVTHRIAQNPGDNLHNMITGVMQFGKNQVELERARTLAKERLLIYERFRSIPLIENDGKSYYWEEVKDVDLTLHVREMRMPDGFDRAALEKHVGMLVTQEPDPRRPQWYIDIIRNYNGDECVVLPQISHVIADGTTLIECLFGLLDRDEETGAAGTGIVKRQAKPLLSLLRDPIALARRFCVFARGLWAGPLLTVLPGDTRTCLRVDTCKNISKQRGISLGESIDLEMVKQIKDSIGATVNDVLTAALAGTLRRYLKHRRDPVVEQRISLRGLFPLNSRPGVVDIKDTKQFGNIYTLLAFPFPVGIEDPMELLFECKRRCDDIKHSPETPLAMKVNQLASKILSPQAYQDQTYATFDRFTLLFSNVPGPKSAVSFAGQRMEDIVFYVPAPIGLVFGVISYNGKIRLGVCCEPKAIPDPDVLARCFKEEVESLHRASQAYLEAERIRDSITASIRPTTDAPGDADRKSVV